MRKSDLQSFKQLLLAMRSRLRGDVSAMTKATLYKTRSESSGDLSSMPIHMADIGSDNFEQEFTISLLQNEGVTLQLIEEALERIDNGTYGVCIECETKIPKVRLKILPYTPYCVKCAAKLEQQRGS